jgi:hypothetical protein
LNPTEKDTWVSVGGIYLPKSALQPFSGQHQLPIMEAITGEEILRHQGGEQELVSLCQNLYWKDCIALASRTGAFLEKYEKYQQYEANIQAKLTDNIYTGDDKHRIEQLLLNPDKRTKRILFHDWQLLLFMKAALLFGADDPNLNLQERAPLARLGQCLLIINDLIADRSKDSRYGIGTNLIESLVRNASFFTREEPKYILPRYYELLSLLPNDPALMKSENYVDIEAAFNDATGLDLNLFLALGFGIFANYVNPPDFHLDKFVLNGSKFFNRTRVPSEKANRLLKRVSLSRDQFRQKHIEKYGSDNLGDYFDFTLFRQKPLIELDDNIYVPTNVRFLVERITSSVYWDICDNLKPPDKFMSFFGEVLQKYVEQLFKRIFPESAATTSRAFYDCHYNTSKGEQRASDVIVFYPNEAVLVEVIVGRLRMEQTITTGDINKFQEDITSKVVDAARQLDRVIRDFKSETLRLPDWHPADMKQYYPVIVTESPLPLFAPTYEEVRRLVKNEKYLITSDIADLEIINVGDMERIEPLLGSGETLTSLLKDKLRDNLYRVLPMWNFLFMTKKHRLLQRPNVYLDKRLQDFAAKMRLLLFEMRDDTREPGEGQ